MLTGLGVGAVAAGTGAFGASGAGAATGGSQDGDLGSAETGVAPPVRSAGVTAKTKMLNTLDWVAINATAYTYVPPGGLTPAATDFFNCAVDLEPGSTILSVSVYLNPGGSTRNVTLGRYDGATPTFANVKSATSTAGSAIETVTIADINHVVLGAPWAYRIGNLSLGTTATLYGGSISYLPPVEAVDPAQPQFFPITPVRVYDSRWTPAPTGVTVGSLASGASRVIAVANGRALSGGAITAADVVPAGATAVTYNLTAVSAAATGGFLAITPGDATSFAASAINWSGAGAIANGGVVPVDGTRQVKVWAGGGGTADVLVDITGYYL